tara:strand:- start:1905 stop:2105 length:201 start_codon:yes stop_codon:yes gene_type:complete
MKMMPARSARSASDIALSIPSADSRCNGSGRRSKASTGIPLFFARFRHIASPMTPRPTKPRVWLLA